MGADERLQRSIAGVTVALRTVIEEMQLTEDEWMQGLAFLTDVGKAEEFILLSDVLGLSVLVDDITHKGDADHTSSNVLGPFYRPEAPMLEPPYHLAGDDEDGEPLLISGTVTSAADSTPLAGALLEIWQADASGKYDLQYGGGEPHLRGRLLAGEGGAYQVRTIVPPPYEIPKDGPVGRLLEALGRHAWRPAHLHLKVSHPGHEPLTTMVYFEGDPWLDSDSIGSVKEQLVMKLDRSEPDDRSDRPYARCRFDVSLAAG